ncbi:MAG: hypothetical protein HYW01_09620 [Deltaproteobacteria bacterium]|nr:hypothetical protein [Deltaproteobacteria bacterium]
MASVKVQKRSEDKETLTFGIDITEGDTKTNHTVEVDKPYYEKLTGGRVTAEELVEKSFMFLLKRESKESILRRFNLKKISYYFPEYENEIKNYF